MPYRHPMRLSTHFGGVNRTRQGGPAGATVCASVSAGLCHTISSMSRRRPIATAHNPAVPPNNVAGQINLWYHKCVPNPCQAKSSCDTPCDRVPRPRTVHWSIHGTPVVHLPPGTYQPDNASSARHGPRHLACSHCAQNGQHHKPCISRALSHLHSDRRSRERTQPRAFRPRVHSPSPLRIARKQSCQHRRRIAQRYNLRTAGGMLLHFAMCQNHS